MSQHSARPTPTDAIAASSTFCNEKATSMNSSQNITITNPSPVRTAHEQNIRFVHLAGRAPEQAARNNDSSKTDNLAIEAFVNSSGVMSDHEPHIGGRTSSTNPPVQDGALEHGSEIVNAAKHLPCTTPNGPLPMPSVVSNTRYEDTPVKPEHVIATLRAFAEQGVKGEQLVAKFRSVISSEMFLSAPMIRHAAFYSSCHSLFKDGDVVMATPPNRFGQDKQVCEIWSLLLWTVWPESYDSLCETFVANRGLMMSATKSQEVQEHCERTREALHHHSTNSSSISDYHPKVVDDHDQSSHSPVNCTEQSNSAHIDDSAALSGHIASHNSLVHHLGSPSMPLAPTSHSGDSSIQDVRGEQPSSLTCPICTSRISSVIEQSRTSMKRAAEVVSSDPIRVVRSEDSSHVDRDVITHARSASNAMVVDDTLINTSDKNINASNAVRETPKDSTVSAVIDEDGGRICESAVRFGKQGSGSNDRIQTHVNTDDYHDSNDNGNKDSSGNVFTITYHTENGSRQHENTSVTVETPIPRRYASGSSSSVILINEAAQRNEGRTTESQQGSDTVCICHHMEQQNIQNGSGTRAEPLTDVSPVEGIYRHRRHPQNHQSHQNEYERYPNRRRTRTRVRFRINADVVVTPGRSRRSSSSSSIPPSGPGSTSRASQGPLPLGGPATPATPSNLSLPISSTSNRTSTSSDGSLTDNAANAPTSNTRAHDTRPRGARRGALRGSVSAGSSSSRRERRRRSIEVISAYLRRRGEVTEQTIEEFLERSRRAAGHVENRAPQHVIDGLEISEVPMDVDGGGGGGNQGGNREDCCICLMGMAIGQRVCKLKGCGHTFHEDCIKTWLTHGKWCPVCRSVVTV